MKAKFDPDEYERMLVHDPDLIREARGVILGELIGLILWLMIGGVILLAMYLALN